MWPELLKLGLRQIWAHKLRSGLTVLAITIGVASIVTLTSLAESGLATLTRGIEEIGGTRFIWIIPAEPRSGTGRRDAYTAGLTQGDRDALAERIPGLEYIVATKRHYHELIATQGHAPVVTTLVATEPDYFQAYHLLPAVGRLWNDGDIEAGGKTMVLGAGLARELFGAGTAVGREVSFQGTRYRVLGVLQRSTKDQVSLGFDWERVAILPRLAREPLAPVEEISVLVKRQEAGEFTIRLANQLLLHRHRGVDDFQFLDFGSLLKNFYLAYRVMTLLVFLIAAVALLIGGVGVMNIMLVAVQERTREIGIRKALGATSRQVMGQFLLEAALLSLAGAAAGIGLGVASVAVASGAIARVAPMWISLFSWGAVVAGVLAAVGTGLFFGWYPAKRAAALDPMVCLRHE
ncbi:MAG: ABC transporter permease [Candidatus Sericytochromatia bacterium]|nr:ABC transporter permease [Candidatus Sericytochromatia bacterium]